MSDKPTATIQIYIRNNWVTAGVFDPKGPSHEDGGYFEYDADYALEKIADESIVDRVGVRYPVNFDLYNERRWPAFLLDILPAGAGRRVWSRRLGISEDYSSDMRLLLCGSGNYPGNIRVLEAVILPDEQLHPGFTKDDVVSKNADFIEYAESKGAVVSGATDVAGDAPKFLLARDKSGNWHPDGALPDDQIKDCWLVKFPRGRTERDRIVLQNEAPYYEVARSFGIRTGKPLEFINDSLFIPRFDRIADQSFVRYGLETLASATGISEYGVPTNHLDLCGTIIQFATDPEAEIREYLRREILNSALRNTDNHARNTAFIKYENGTVELSPLYDFAPMFLDPAGIGRASKWEGIEPKIGIPDWVAVGRIVGEMLNNNPDELVNFLGSFVEPVNNLPAAMVKAGVEAMVIEKVSMRCQEIANGLQKCR